MNEVVVTGMGVISSAGLNVKEFFRNLESPDFNNFTRTPEIRLNIDLLLGEIARDQVSKPKNREFDNPTSRLCIQAANECLQDYRNKGGKTPLDGLILGTSTGGQEVCENFIGTLLEQKNLTSGFSLARGEMAAPTRAVAQELGIEGRAMTVSTACTSSANAIAMGASMIKEGRADCIIAGGGDALCGTTMAGFHILKLTGAERARPFGQNRPGLSLGEGAAFLILEPKEKVSRENRRYYAELIGYGMTSDAYHMTAPSENGEGAVEVMKRSLEMAKLKPGEIDFINAHGTGTVMNDRTEATAIRSVFGENTPVASVKGLLGHTLGAAGAIEAVASIYSILKQKAFENFNSYQKGEDCDVNLVPRGGKTLKKAPVVLSNSFAFGGNNCTLIFKGVD